MRCGAVLALLLLLPAAAPAQEPLAVAAFSALSAGDALPPAWREVKLPRIPRTTDYALALADGRTALRAESERAMSSLARSVDIDPAAFPHLRWHWRVDALNAQSDLSRRDGDDFPVRLYVLFDYDLRRLPFWQRTRIRLARALYGAELPSAALCYVWATHEPAGTSAWNAYTDRVRMIVVASGAQQLGRWVAFERDVRRDFREAFGEDAPRITGIAIASDTDDTGGHTLAWYGDIAFLPAQAQ